VWLTFDPQGVKLGSWTANPEIYARPDLRGSGRAPTRLRDQDPGEEHDQTTLGRKHCPTFSRCSAASKRLSHSPMGRVSAGRCRTLQPSATGRSTTTSSAESEDASRGRSSPSIAWTTRIGGMQGREATELAVPLHALGPRQRPVNDVQGALARLQGLNDPLGLGLGLTNGDARSIALLERRSTHALDVRTRTVFPEFGQLAELLGLTLGLRSQASPQTGHWLRPSEWWLFALRAQVSVLIMPT
jgi:hypothetical protein